MMMMVMMMMMSLWSRKYENKISYPKVGWKAKQKNIKKNQNKILKRPKTKSFAHRWVDRRSRRWEGLEASTYVGTGDLVTFSRFLTFELPMGREPWNLQVAVRYITLYWLTSLHLWPCHWWKKTLTRGSVLNVSANQRPLHHISSRPSWDVTSSNEKIFQRMCFPVSRSQVFWFQADQDWLPNV